jgi:hypothetical protein
MIPVKHRFFNGKWKMGNDKSKIEAGSRECKGRFPFFIFQFPSSIDDCREHGNGPNIPGILFAYLSRLLRPRRLEGIE